MAGIAIEPSGDADRDFVAMMVPHHVPAPRSRRVVTCMAAGTAVRQPVLPSRSKRIMMVPSTRGSSATPYSVLPERMSVTHASCELRRVTRFLLVTTVPDQVDAFARLFVPDFDGLQAAVNVPSSLI